MQVYTAALIKTAIYLKEDILEDLKLFLSDN